MLKTLGGWGIVPVGLGIGIRTTPAGYRQCGHYAGYPPPGSPGRGRCAILLGEISGTSALNGTPWSARSQIVLTAGQPKSKPHACRPRHRQPAREKKAVLDLNLHGQSTYHVADALSEAGVRFVFVTGYDTGAIDPAYRDYPVAKSHSSPRPSSPPWLLPWLVRLRLGCLITTLRSSPARYRRPRAAGAGWRGLPA